MELKRKSISRESATEAEGEKETSGKGKPAVTDAPSPAENRNRPAPLGGRGGKGLEHSEVENEEDDQGLETDGTDGRKKRSWKKVALYGVVSLCLLGIVAGVLSFRFGWHRGLVASKPKLEPITSIKRPIPVPDYREMLDFLLLYDVDGQKMITALRMEFGYQSPTRYQNFKEQNVLMRDTIYSFLLRQNMSKHTVKSWHAVIEKDLLEFLRVQLPQSQADSIRLTQVENL